MKLAFLLLVASLIGACWAQWNPNYVAGRHTMVHLFEWKWDDIADECERFLGPKGFGGVQVKTRMKRTEVVVLHFQTGDHDLCI